MTQRTVRGFVCILCIIYFSLSFGCKKSIPISDIPLDQLKVTPVTTPTVYRYGPCSGEFEMTTIKEFNGKKESQTIFTRYSVIQDGQQLIWHMFIPKWSENGKKYSPRLPLIDFTMDTDLRGNLGTLEVYSPLMQSMGEQAETKFKAGLDEVRKKLQNVSPPLPTQGIVTGQPLRNNSLDRPQNNIILSNSDVALTLDGEFTIEGIVYVLASMNEELILTDSKSNAQMFMTMAGHSIMQKDTMELVSGDFQVEMSDAMGTTHASAFVTMKRLN